MNSEKHLIKQPAAWVPIVMSLTVLGAMLISIAMFGVPVREPDEGTAAHLFQIWLVLEIITISFFAIAYLPSKPRELLPILVLQIAAAIVACAPVFLLKL